MINFNSALLKKIILVQKGSPKCQNALTSKYISEQSTPSIWKRSYLTSMSKWYTVSSWYLGIKMIFLIIMVLFVTLAVPYSLELAVNMDYVFNDSHYCKTIVLLWCLIKKQEIHVADCWYKLMSLVVFLVHEKLSTSKINRVVPQNRKCKKVR